MAGGWIVETREVKNYSGKVTLFLVFTCIVAATGGLIVGYDIGISGRDLDFCFHVPFHFRAFQ